MLGAADRMGIDKGENRIRTVVSGLMNLPVHIKSYSFDLLHVEFSIAK